MWEADPRHAELAVAERGLQAARPQVSTGGAKANAPLDRGEVGPDGQKAYPSVSVASNRPDNVFACKECSRAVGMR